MPRLLLGVLCDDVRTETDGKQSLMGIFDQVTLPTFNHPFPDFRLFAVVGVEASGEHDLSVAIHSADNSFRHNIVGKVHAVERSETYGLFVVPVNIRFSGLRVSAAGLYYFTFIVDSVDIDRIPVIVKLRDDHGETTSSLTSPE